MAASLLVSLASPGQPAPVLQAPTSVTQRNSSLRFVMKCLARSTSAIIPVGTPRPRQHTDTNSQQPCSRFGNTTPAGTSPYHQYPFYHSRNITYGTNGNTTLRTSTALPRTHLPTARRGKTDPRGVPSPSISTRFILCMMHPPGPWRASCPVYMPHGVHTPGP